MDSDPALGAIWHRINMEAKRDLFAVLTEHVEPDADPVEVRLRAAAAASAIRIALELWASRDDGEDPADFVIRCMRELRVGG
ncbi:hypothetical protein ACFXG4_29590 [Nocardia sp. NPDC059246]|uniref:hypothetical protein n=1 Tax=unclassified Nocardia TaxID=2637762 RepID=UPI0036CC2979